MNPPGPWFLCADRRAHYLADGSALCGAAAGVKEPVRRGVNNNLANMRGDQFCEECQERNALRWAGLARGGKS